MRFRYIHKYLENWSHSEAELPGGAPSSRGEKMCPKGPRRDGSL